MEIIAADMEAMVNSTVHLRRDRSAEDHVLEGDLTVGVEVEVDTKEATETAAADSVTENLRVERDHVTGNLRMEMVTPQVTRASIKNAQLVTTQQVPPKRWINVLESFCKTNKTLDLLRIFSL